MKVISVLRLVSAATLCALLAACGDEPVPVSSSAPLSAPSSASETAPTPEPVPESRQLTADLPVEGALTLTESDIFDGYEHVSPFFNGWAFVYKDGQAGYISEEGEYKPLYTVSSEDLYGIDFIRTPSIYVPGTSYSSRRGELYWMGQNFRCSESGVVPYYRDGKWGYSDLDGNLVVEPVYDQLTWLGQVGYGLRNEYGESNSGISPLYDIFNSQGEVIATTATAGWADPTLGYYMLYNEQTGNADLYNADGSLVMADIPYSTGNCPWPDCDVYAGGIVVNGVAYDRTGAELPIDAQTIDLFQGDLLALFDQQLQDDIGTDLNGNPLLDAGLWLVSDPDENGGRYIGVQGSGSIRLYNAQFEEQTTPPLLYASQGTLYLNDAGEDVTPIRILDQDGNEVLVLEAVNCPEYPVYYPAEPLEEGDWLYWCPDRDTLIPYRVTATQ